MAAYSRGRTIPMTPDASVKWEAHETSAGTLYLPPDADEVALRALGRKNRRRDRIGRGEFGRVFALDECVAPAGALVVKEFIRRKRGGQLPDLQANVTVAAGMDRVKNSFSNWDIKGAAILGAFIADHETGKGAATQWVMERVPNVLPRRVNLERYGFPSEEERIAHYVRAVRACGGRPDDFIFDEDPSNLLVVRIPDDNENGLAYKIDVMASPHVQ